MKAKIRLDGSLLEQIDVQNGLRQGCCMVPVLFNLFSSLVIEQWQARGVCVYMWLCKTMHVLHI